MTNTKTAIILGATGLTGSLLLKKLLSDDSYATVKLFSRKASGITSPKIKEFIGDIIQLENFASDFTADVVFCCIGTTKAKTKDESVYRTIDYGIPVKAAQLAKENNISTFIVISAMGANIKSSIFYNRTKGEMERDVLLLEIPRTYILQPSLILGNRTEHRAGEKIAAFFMQFFTLFLIGGLKKYRAIEAKAIANTMFNLVGLKLESQILESDRIQENSEQY